MKHHIVTKAIALFLCSLTLFTAGISGLAFLIMAAMGLSQNANPEERYQEYIRSSLRWSANTLIARYASTQLGGCPEDIQREYYGNEAFGSNFREERISYTLRDAEGNVVDSTYDGTGADAYEFPNQSAYYLSIAAGPVNAAHISDAWLLLRQQLGMPEVQPAQPPEVTMAIPVEDEFSEPEQEEWESNDLWTTEPETLNVEIASFRSPNTYYAIRNQLSPTYTVTIYLEPDAIITDTGWTLLRTAWSHQTQIAIVLGVSALLFAVLAVYLCCTAGHAPGSDELRPGGLNRLPLDVYALAIGSIITALLVLGVEGAEFMIRQGMTMVQAYYGYAGFLCCLLVVGFCFAFAAQVKVPHWYILKNTLCGRCFGLFLRGCRLGRTWIVQLVQLLPKLFRGILTVCKTLLLFALGLCRNGLHWLGTQIRKLMDKLERFYRMLPLTWQWLTAGACMPILLLIAFSTRRAFWILLAIAACALLILYGANCFGNLLRSTRRMRSGDLESKVQDGLLIGSFREFAEELNGLADVAMVAAQKQLKSERMKTELITNVSHDIKTPLTSIINYVDLLQMPHTPEQEQMYLETLSRQSQRMKKLIEDLIEMSKASTGNIPVEITRVDAAEAVNQALGEFSDKLEAATLSIVYHQPEEELAMFADGRLVWRAMSNVLSNTVKYAMPGTRVYVDLTGMDGKVMISVKNISRDQLNISAEELMERFVRGDSSRNTEGSGLGLNIAQSLMQLQHGELQLLVDGDLFKATLIFPMAE